MSDLSTPAGSVVSAPRWPDALLRVIHERDRAQARAVRLEQENAELLDLVRRFVQIFEDDRDGSVDLADHTQAVRTGPCVICQAWEDAEALLDRIDNPREDN